MSYHYITNETNVCPVDGKLLVDVVFWDGHISHGMNASGWGWSAEDKKGRTIKLWRLHMPGHNWEIHDKRWEETSPPPDAENQRVDVVFSDGDVTTDCDPDDYDWQRYGEDTPGLTIIEWRITESATPPDTPDRDGWIWRTPSNDDEPPIDGGTVVEIMRYDGETASGEEASNYDWDYDGYNSDIVKWRPHKDKDETDYTDHVVVVKDLDYEGQVITGKHVEGDVFMLENGDEYHAKDLIEHGALIRKGK